MLQISEQTSNRFNSEAEDRFIGRLVEFLVSKAPELKTLGRDEMYRQTRLVVETARQYGFESEREIATFALTSAFLGMDFHQAMGGAREILAMNESAEYRAKLLEYFTREMFDIVGQG